MLNVKMTANRNLRWSSGDGQKCVKLWFVVDMKELKIQIGWILLMNNVTNEWISDNLS